MSKKHIRIISHTHWDREWYLNAKYVNEWLIDFFDSLFEMFEREPEYKFMLDGQLSIVEDLLDEVQKSGANPQDYKDKIRHYVENGNLFIGPYYLQPDWQLISEEAAVRNLLIGNNIAKTMGGAMKVGWLPDNFGQISQTAQLHKGFGIDGLFVWRGVNFVPERMSTEFIWESPDGSKVTSVYLMCGYRNAMRLAETPDIMKGRIHFEADKLIEFGNTDNVLMLNGYDQEIKADNILPYIKDGKMDDEKYDIKQTSPDKYMSAIQDSIDDNLDVIKGQMYNGRYGSVFPGILSSRMYIKQRNEYSQRLVERYAERVCTMLSLMGKDYPKESFDKAWKLIIKSHPHDSICAVSIDDVATDMMERYNQADNISNSLLNESAYVLTGNIDTTNDFDAISSYVVVNTLFNKRDVILTIPIEEKIKGFCDINGNMLNYSKDGSNYIVEVKDVPACGYITIYGVSRESLNKKTESSNNTLENEYLKAVIEDDGTITLTQKSSGHTYSGLLCYEDGGDMGDEYNYSYVEGEKIIYSTDFKPTIKREYDNELMQRYRIETVLDIPVGLSTDRKSRCENKRQLPIVTFVTLKKGAKYLEFRTELKNTVKDHRLRVLFPTGINASKSYAQTQFDITSHDIDQKPYKKLPENVEGTVRGAYEPMPATTFPQRSFCGVENDGMGMAVLNYGLPEHEVLAPNRTIALTLFRSVGIIANTTFPTRIGDAGPYILTPEAQCLREMSFEYAVYPYSDNKDKACVINQADEFNTPVLTYKTNIHNGSLSNVSEIIKVTNDKGIAVSAMKRAENNSGIVIRLYNTASTENEAVINSSIPINEANLSMLNEEELRSLTIEDNKVKVNIPSGKIINVLLKMPKQPVLIYNEYNQLLPIEILKPKCDFDDFKSEEIITKAEVLAEKARAERLAKKAKEIKKEISKLNPDDKITYNSAVMREEAVNREFLEANISSLLIEKKLLQFSCTNCEKYANRLVEIDDELRDNGMKLNLSRISKRKQEYIVDYYNGINND